MGSVDHPPRYLNYPEPRKGPDIAYKNERKANPALSGVTLLIAAFLLEWIWFLPRIIWHNAGFGGLRTIRKHLEDYEPRLDPTVIPIENPFADDQEVDTQAGLRARTKLQKSTAESYYSVTDYHKLYLSGELTPVAVARAILPLIRRDISPTGEHSVAWFDCKVDLVLAAAEASTRRYMEKRPLGLLDGVPTAVKDEYDLDNYRSCLGSLNDYTGEETPGQSITSWCAKKMEEAGAIILGKLSMHEFGLDTSGNNPHYGTPPNPYNPQYYPGGSSSGCAYAVSTGLIPIALGSDGGGSIRIPSSFCSIVGLKPTHGRLSHHPGINHSNSCGVNGPLAADIESLAAFYQVIGMPYPSSSFPAPSRSLLSTPRQRKVLGVPQAWFDQSTPAIQRLCQSLLGKLVSTYGYTLIPIEIPFLVEGQTAHAMTVLTDAATLLPSTTNITPGNKILLSLGSTTPSTDYLLAQKLRLLLMQHLAHLWKDHPGMIIVTPTTSCAGWCMKDKSELKYGVSDGDQTLKTMEYVWLANFTGLPALTVPAGFVGPQGGDDEGMEAAIDTKGKVPVGLMGTGEWGREDHLLQWGLDAEDLGYDRRCRPSIWVDVVQKAKEGMGDTVTVGRD